MKSKILYPLVFFVLAFLFVKCEKSDTITPDEKVEIKTSKGVEGNIQKGPFISGSSVIIQELDSSFISTGKSFNTTTKDDFGGFKIGSIIESPFIEVITSGFYYDEVKGTISNANLSLRSLVKTTDTTLTNVNLLTTLAKERIEYLVQNQEGKFKVAKRVAQNEILNIFDIPTNDTINFNELDISLAGDENAILLATSIIIQGNLSVGEVSEMISKIILDLKEDGRLDNESILETLKNNASKLNLASVRTNLEKRYQELNYNANIPAFEKFAKRLVQLEVIGASPTKGEKEVPYNLKEISIRFNKALDKASINSNNILVTDINGDMLEGDLIYDENEYKVKLVLNQELAPDMKYKIQVKPELKTLDGEFMGKTYTQEFNSLSVDLENALKAYYTFNGDFLDHTENNYNATPHNISFSAGKTDSDNNQAALFSGKGSYMTFPNVINPTQLNWSYSIWVKINEKDETNGPILLGTNLSSSPFWDVPLYFRASSQKFSSYNGKVLESPISVDNKEWYHIVITIENAHQKMYVNGELSAEEDYYTPSSEDGDRNYNGFDGEDIGLYNFYNAELYISQSWGNRSDWTPFLNGCVDNVRFYDRAINKFEVKELYEQQK